MKEEYNDFIGIYDESVPLELCDEFVKNYEEAKKNRTVIDLTKENDTGLFDGESHDGLDRKDESVVVTPLTSTIYPRPPVDSYFDFLQECFKCYIKRYSIRFNCTIFNDVFKIHKVKKSEGYHVWHHEKALPSNLNRLMAYMTYLEVPNLWQQLQNATTTKIGSQRELTGSIGWSRSYGLHKKILTIPDKN